MEKAKTDSINQVTASEPEKRHEAELEDQRRRAAVAKAKAEQEKSAQKLIASTEPNDVDISKLQSTEKASYLSGLVRKYGEGKHQRKIEERNRIITIIVVVAQGKATEYKWVKTSFGGNYYFKNGSSISKNQYGMETS